MNDEIVCNSMNYGSLILAFLLGVFTALLLVENSKQKKEGRTSFWQKVQISIIWIQALWYPILLVMSSAYIVFHYPECIQFSFFDDFQGDNIIFLLWLLLLCLPMLSKFKFSGITIEFWNKSKFSEYVAEKAKDTKNIASLEELEELNKRKEETDE